MEIIDNTVTLNVESILYKYDSSVALLSALKYTATISSIETSGTV